MLLLITFKQNTSNTLKALKKLKVFYLQKAKSKTNYLQENC